MERQPPPHPQSIPNEAKIMPEKSNIDITIGYENYWNLASYKVSDFDTVVSENEHLGEEKCLRCF